jgi:hypothetical protein
MKSAEEVKREYQDQMGIELGSVYYALTGEVVRLHAKWASYVTLFGTSEARVVLLNRASAGFFGSLQSVMWEDVLLHISRLTDRSESGRRGRQNLTISKLVQLIVSEEIHAEVLKRSKVIHDAAAFCRDWRNRRIAHADFELAIGSAARSLEPASRKKVKNVIRLLDGFMNSINRYYQGSEVLFDDMDSQADAEQLLYVIDDGLRFEAERRAIAANGRAVPPKFAMREI